MKYYPLFRCLFGGALLALLTCATNDSQNTAVTDPMPPGESAERVRLVTLDPGHFHAALVQKTMYPGVDSTVHVYAPAGQDLDLHEERIARYNDGDDATAWKQVVYTGPDYLERMLADGAGNVVVLSGNNGRKTEYIRAAIDGGLNVLADKPMVIDPAEYGMLEDALRKADASGLLLYDIMTERFEVTTMLQRALSQEPSVFGELLPGTVDEPAISKESVHHFSKTVSGAPLIRPAWFFDVAQQGEGMVDVATHLVDLILWEAFPDEPIDTTEVEVLRARRWSTDLSQEQFAKVTGLQGFPEDLEKDVRGDKLEVFSNGQIDFTVRGIHGKAAVIWNFEAPPGAADTHYSIMRGSGADLVIRQDAAQQYVPTLYVEPKTDLQQEKLQRILDGLQNRFPGVSARAEGEGYVIDIPEALRKGHEAHFGQVTEQFLQYLAAGEMPEWERTNMLTKYYVTTNGYNMSR